MQPNQPATKPAPKNPKQDQPAKPDQAQKPHDPKLPTPDHVAAKESKEHSDNESMNDQPGTFRLPGNEGPGRREIDTQTLSDQPGAKRPKE